MSSSSTGRHQSVRNSASRGRKPAVERHVRPLWPTGGFRPRLARLVATVAIALGTAIVGCDRQPKLLIYSGAGIRPATAELAETFGRRHGVQVECDYAGSEMLLSRIKLSRKGDLYMPGDLHYVAQAEDEGLVTESKTACYFVPVILVPKGNPRGLASLRDLADPQVALGLGDPNACAIGRKSSKLFANSGIDETKLNVAVRTLTVNELGTLVKLGKLDAAIVWDAVAANFTADTDVVPIPPEENFISTVPVGVLSFSEHPELARRFVEFATSEEGAAIFRKHHYTVRLPESTEPK